MQPIVSESSLIRANLGPHIFCSLHSSAVLVIAASLTLLVFLRNVMINGKVKSFSS